MKKIFLISFLMIILSFFSLNAKTVRYPANVDLDDGKMGERYETVQIYCLEMACILFCRDPGPSYVCSWDDATWCEECDEDFFNDGSGSEMFNYAKGQINNGSISGSYQNNIYIEEQQRYIYRTVNWSVVNQEASIEVVLSE